MIYVDTPVEVSQARLAERAGRDLYDSADLQRRVAAATSAPLPRSLRRERSCTGSTGGCLRERIAEQVWKVVLSLPIIRA